MFLDAHRSQIPVRRLRRTGTPTRVGEAGEGAPGQLPLPWWVSPPPLWPSRAPSPCSPSPGRPDDSPPPPPHPPRHESSGPGVYGVALGTGGRAKVPGVLHASRGWAPLSAAVVSSPLMGLFYHQVSADTVCFGVCHRGNFGSLDVRGALGLRAASSGPRFGPCRWSRPPGPVRRLLCGVVWLTRLVVPPPVSGRPEGGGARRRGSSTLCAPRCGHPVKAEMRPPPCGLRATCQAFSNLLGSWAALA